MLFSKRGLAYQHVSQNENESCMRAVLSGAYQSLALHREDRRHADRQSNGAVDLLYGQAEADPRDGLEATRLNTSLITRQHAFHLCTYAC